MQRRTRTEAAAQAVLTTKGATVAYRHPTPSITAWACADADPEQFFPEDDATLALARAICAECPVRDVCRALGIARGETGVWGGVLLADGRILDRVPAMGRPRKETAA